MGAVVAWRLYNAYGTYQDIKVLVSFDASTGDRILAGIGIFSGTSRVIRVAKGAKVGTKALRVAKKTSKATDNIKATENIMYILLAAKKGKGNFRLGSATRSKAWEAGRSWVGPGAKEIKNSKGQIIGYSSKDGMRAFRLDYKRKLGKYQANFQQNAIVESTGKVYQVGNGHLDILDLIFKEVK